MFFTRFAFVTILCVSSLAARISLRQESTDSSVGQPVSVGVAANRTAPANETFGTAEREVNFTEMPTSLCVVPQFAKQAGINPGNDTEKLLITQQALDLCPQAASIVTSNVTTSGTNSSKV
ncbi:hypothetical protein CTheo_9130 [Ceratobasidium theobromae]|uniref:Effector protein n=1 Tax=Ceratobasidium theobromae TaxID=1582974 RepID=A0A5N5Q680_9AGAM|nr:hypothetical protein CTheo_9130 [Ceratobasidium theobromae]